MDPEHQGLVADLLGLLAKGADAVDRSDDREHIESCGGCVAIAVVSAERSRAWLPDFVALRGPAETHHLDPYDHRPAGDLGANSAGSCAK